MKNILVLLTVITLFSSCAKDGAPGPQGPQGNANVVAGNYDVKYSAWSIYTPSQGLWFYTVSVTDNDITPAIVSNGSVSAFISFDNNTWYNLPYNDFQTSTFFINYRFLYSAGVVSFDIVPSDGGAITLYNDYYFKVVAIAGSIVKKHPGTNWNNYEEVMQVMGQENK